MIKIINKHDGIVIFAALTQNSRDPAIPFLFNRSKAFFIVKWQLNVCSEIENDNLKKEQKSVR